MKKLYLIPSIVLIISGKCLLFLLYCSFTPVTESTFMDMFLLDHYIAYTILMIITILAGIAGFWLKNKGIVLQLVVFAIYFYGMSILPPSLTAL